MASIQANNGNGKRALDHEVPLIPFIDLLLCCVMFLLITAVWNQLASITVNQKLIVGPGDMTAPDEGEKLMVQITDGKMVVATSLGVRHEIANLEGVPDLLALRNRLSEQRELSPNLASITVAPEDGIRYESIIGVMDLAYASGYSDVSLSDGAML